MSSFDFGFSSRVRRRDNDNTGLSVESGVNNDETITTRGDPTRCGNTPCCDDTDNADDFFDNHRNL